MGQSYRVEIDVWLPDGCLVAEASLATDGTITDIAKTGPVEDGYVTEEFSTTGFDREVIDGVTTIATFDDKAVHQFERPVGEACFCECIESLGQPISDIHAANGRLHAGFFAPTLEAARTIMRELNDRYDSVHLNKLTQIDSGNRGELAFLDKSQLTDRQREVIETAIKMGYFEYPKAVNAGDVAKSLGITRSTFREHLTRAQSKLLTSLFTLEERQEPTTK